MAVDEIVIKLDIDLILADSDIGIFVDALEQSRFTGELIIHIHTVPAPDIGHICIFLDAADMQIYILSFGHEKLVKQQLFHLLPILSLYENVGIYIYIHTVMLVGACNIRNG